MTSGTAPDADHLRGAFTGFFAGRGHVPVPSASLIPHDPSVLFTIAGMVPFKPFFLGDEVSPWPRATSVQKCFRTVDIDVVGHTERHCTFFEMLGNFSFGDYFKAEAIPFAWELVTEVLGIDGDRIWVTVYESDDEAEQIWRDAVGVPAGRIQRLGDDNFWKMGDTGPCGPSSELFFDKGPPYGADGGPALGGSERFIEIWNLVFMQYNRSLDGSIEDLPKPSIDTGAGLERILPVIQGVDSIFATDLFLPMIETAQSVTGRTYGSDPGVDVGLRILADHGRAMSMLVSDGVLPANEGRGYVLRRVIRRAVRRARQLGFDGAVTPRLVDTAVGILGAAYPALAEQHHLVLDVVGREEEGFLRTLATGSTILEEELASGAGAVSGDLAFRLHDTYGFPVELTVEIAEEAGVTVDLEGFEAAMDVQRAQARAAARANKTPAGEQAYRSVLDDEGQTVFVGQRPDGYSAPARVVAVLADLDPDHAGQAEIFLDRTPFYAEGGGQDGDTGTIVTETGTAVVYDTVSALPGLTSHHATINGELFAGQDALATIDGVRRDSLRRNHTGTHLLHAALRTVLGRPRPPAGLPRGTGLPALRLQPPRECGPRGAGGGGVPGQRRRPDRRRRHRGGDLQGPGRGHGGPGLLRGQVRRAGPGGPGRSPLHRAVRRDPCRCPRHDRPHHRHVGVVHRLQRPPAVRRHRHQRLRPPGGAGGPAHRGGRPAPHRARARPRGHRPAAGAATCRRALAGAGSQPRAAVRAPRRWPPRRWTASWSLAGTAWIPTRCATWPRPCGPRPPSEPWSWVGAPTGPRPPWPCRPIGQVTTRSMPGSWSSRSPPCSAGVAGGRRRWRWPGARTRAVSTGHWTRPDESSGVTDRS